MAFSSTASSKTVSALQQIMIVGELYAFTERSSGIPTTARQASNVEQLLRRAVGARGVVGDLAAITDDLGNHARELRDGDVLAGADIDEVAS